MASFPARRSENMTMVDGRLLKGEEMENYCKKHGLCTICGEVQTHKRVGRFSRTWEPMTVENANGNVTVYKGHCIQATCYTSVEQVKEMLGEIPKKKMPRSPNPVSPVPAKSTTKVNSPSATSLPSSSGSQRKQFQTNSIYVPPFVPSLEKEGSMNFRDLSDHGQENLNGSSSGYLDTSHSKMDGLPSEENVKSVSKAAAYHSKATSRRLRQHRNSDGSENEFTVSLYNPEGGGASSRIYGSLRSSFQSMDLGVPSQCIGLAREHSLFLLGSTPRDLGGSGLGIVSEGTNNAAVGVLQAQISEGDYVKFIAELDRRCATGIDEEEKSIVLEGFRLFRYHVVKDQLSRPNGVVLPGENWVKTLTKKMEDCNSDKDIVVSSLLTFLTLSTLPGPTYKKSMLKKGGLDEVMKILDQYKGDKQVPALACSIFLSLGLSEKDGLNAKFDKILVLVKRLVALVTNGEWGRDFALRALFHFSFQRRKAAERNKSLSHDVKYFLSTQENLRSLSEIIREDHIRETAVESSLSLLWRLSGPKDNKEDEDLLPVSPDVVDAIISAMYTFKSATIRESGCGILANMSMREIFPSEKVEAALVCIHTFLEDPNFAGMVDENLATCSMHAICNMLEDPSSVNIAMSVRSSVTGSTLGTMKRFPESEELVEFACLVLAQAARENHAAKEFVMFIGGFDQVIAAFEEFVTKRAEKPSLEVKDAALCAMASLAGCRIGAEAVMNSGLLEILQTLLAVETDKDFAEILGVVLKNTEIGLSGGFDSNSTLDTGCDKPQILEDYLKNASSAADAAVILRNFIGMGQSGLEASVAEDRGLFTALLATLSTHRNEQKVQEAGVALLAEIYYFVPCPTEIALGPWHPQCQRESLQAIDRAMDIHRDNIDIQINGSLVILNLMSGLKSASSDRSTVISLMERCLNRLLETLMYNDSNKTIQKCGIAALGACIYISDKEILTEWNARIVRQLFEVLSKCNGDSEIQTLVLEGITILLGARQGIDSIGKSDGICLLLDLLGSSSTTVCAHAAAVLASVVENDFLVSGCIMEVPDSIARLFLCMGEHQDDGGIQVCIACILESLVNFAEADAIETILRNNGVAALCNLMSIHPSNGDLVIHICNILSSIFPCLDTATIVSMKDFIKPSLVDALQRHVEDAEVEAAVFDALWACCQQEDTFKILLLEESRVRMILSAMQLNLGSEELQRSGCSLLWMLSISSDGKEKIGSCGGIPTIVNALLAHNDSTAVQKEGLIALKNLAIASQNKPMLVDAGGENAVMCSLWIHYRDPQVIALGLSAMNNIAVDAETRSVAEMNDQILLIVISAMSRYPDNCEVQKNACFFLKSCSFLPTNLDLMRNRRHHLAPLLRRAADSYPDFCRDRAQSIVSKMQ